MSRVTIHPLRLRYSNAYLLLGDRPIRRGKPNFHYFADDLPMAMASLDRILAASAGHLYVGHGGPLRRNDVARWRASHRRGESGGGLP